jgi:hypothetical protein
MEGGLFWSFDVVAVGEVKAQANEVVDVNIVSSAKVCFDVYY